jgi:hypothetical protein
MDTKTHPFWDTLPWNDFRLVLGELTYAVGDNGIAEHQNFFSVGADMPCIFGPLQS